MREQIEVGKEFNIISRKIDNATTCQVSAIFDEYFEITLNTNEEYKAEESVELFAMTSKGQLYFETIVKEVNENKLLIWFPISFKYLQRREYTRITINKEIQIDNQNAQIIDISAGGLKLKLNNQLKLLQEYPISINLDNNIINCNFLPIRISANNNEFISSGKYTNLNNQDKITLVQYCFGKQFENRNK